MTDCELKQLIPVTIATTSSEYSIFIGYGILAKLEEFCTVSKYSKVHLVVDANVPEEIIVALTASISCTATKLTVSEELKSIETVNFLWKKFYLEKLDRKSLILILGGGCLGDLAGFAATTFKRGIPFIQIPTTLLAQTDASIGGKLAVNFSGVKNLIGSFAQPQNVVIDIDLLSSLPTRELMSGIAEIVKHGVIADKSVFESLATSFDITSFDKILNQQDQSSRKNWLEILTLSIEVKRKLVEEDEHEVGIRKLLNYGHTIGHALEAFSHETDDYLLHGEAISIGMVLEAKLASKLGLCDDQLPNQIAKVLLRYSLPIDIPTKLINHPDFVTSCLNLMMNDKKNLSNKISLSLPENIGKALYDILLTKQELTDFLKSFRNEYS
jgi:3-dehydroquinate synthase